MREISINAESGYTTGSNLHAEDVMLYGSRNTIPNDEKLIRLHKLVVDKCDGMGWSHCSLASVAAKPKLLSKVSEIILQKQPWWGAEIGIETGSPDLAKKMMPAKAHPFKAEEWPEVVRTGMGLMHDNMLVPACTLIVGAPDETPDDLNKTIELMDDLRGVRSLIVPLFFVPMGRLNKEDWFKDSEMSELHNELLIKCLDHGLYWIDELIDMSFKERWYRRLIKQFYRGFAAVVRWKVKRAGIVHKEVDN
jgi:radical SAM superfamily enzyme YgiQ (UPF0313 family)